MPAGRDRSARCCGWRLRVQKATFAGPCGNDEIAPRAVVLPGTSFHGRAPPLPHRLIQLREKLLRNDRGGRFGAETAQDEFGFDGASSKIVIAGAL